MLDRLAAITAWFEGLGYTGFSIAPASNDASFRRYFRASKGDESWVLMDAPPEHEDNPAFIRVAQLLADAGLNVPQVLAQDLARGFLLLSDLGNRTYLDELNATTVDALYGDAFTALITLQANVPDSANLPPYDAELLQREMALFPDWLLGTHLQLSLTAAEHAVLDSAFALLTSAALAQPQVCVHRDYHCRNLMICDDNPGVLDFQDAVHGPVTYDLVSLLRDCYIDWPWDTVHAWIRKFYQQAKAAGVPIQEGEAAFLRDFDLMTAQRHLKTTGIFARLYRRDGKARYLADIPRALNYVIEAASRQPALADLHQLLVTKVQPAL